MFKKISNDLGKNQLFDLHIDVKDIKSFYIDS